VPALKGNLRNCTAPHSRASALAGFGLLAPAHGPSAGVELPLISCHATTWPTYLRSMDTLHARLARSNTRTCQKSTLLMPPMNTMMYLAVGPFSQSALRSGIHFRFFLDR
jgi:hypothetical protein